MRLIYLALLLSLLLHHPSFAQTKANPDYDKELAEKLEEIMKDPSKMQDSTFTMQMEMKYESSGAKTEAGVKYGPWVEYSSDWEEYVAKLSVDEEINYMPLLKLEGAYKDGQREGEWQVLVQDLDQSLTDWQLRRTIHYKQGKKHGLETEYLPNQMGILSKATYKDGKPHGQYILYNPEYNDQPILTEEYKNGVLEGKQLVYNADKVLEKETSFKKGQKHGPYKQFYPSGKLAGTVNYTEGKAQGAFLEYYESGKLMTQGAYQNDQKAGVWKKYYEDGTLQQEYTYADNVLNGSFKYFHTNGQLWRETILKQGKMWSVVANYTKDGKAVEAGTLKDGNGTLLNYDEQGKLVGKVVYKNGEEVKE